MVLRRLGEAALLLSLLGCVVAQSQPAESKQDSSTHQQLDAERQVRQLNTDEVQAFQDNSFDP